MNENSVRTPAWVLAPLAALVVVLPIEGTVGLRNALFFLVVSVAGIHFRRSWQESRAALSLPLARLWLAYALVAGLGLFWAADFSYSLKEIRQEILFAAIFFWLGVNLCRDDKGWRWLSGALVGGNLFLVGYCLAVWASGGTTKGPWVATYKSGPGNFSTYLVTVLPVIALLAAQAFRRRDRPWSLFLSLLMVANFAAIYATANRQIYVAVAIQILVAGAFFARRLRQPRYLLALAAFVVVLGSLFHIQTSSRIGTASVAQSVDIGAALNADGRLPVWKFAVSESLGHPLIGAGMGRNAYSRQYAGHPLAQPPFDHTHNMLVNRLVQLGVPGLLVFLALFGAVAWMMRVPGFRGIEDGWFGIAGVAICAGVFAKNMTDDFFVRELGYLFWLICGALIGHQAGGSGMIMKDIRKIIVVRRDNIGDLICTTPLFSALRAHFPSARIDALVNSYNSPVLARNPDIDHVYAYTKAKHREVGESTLGVYGRRLRLMLSLRAQGYDCMVLANDGDTKRTLKLARWIAPGQVIGYAMPGEAADRRLDQALTVNPAHRHAVEIAFALLAPLGIHGTPPAMKLVPDPDLLQRARTRLDDEAGSVAGPTIAIHVSARKVPQRWPTERFIELMRLLHARCDARFMLFWAPGSSDNPMHPGDDDKAREIVAATAGLPVLAYRTEHLDQLIAGIAACDSMICSDGGAMHVGAALGKPIVCFFGNSDAARWHPWGVPHQVLQPPSLDVNDISVAEALAACERLGIAGRSPA
ncbi:glycosyltransferase family 9 protein [Dechloromonas sp. H13]|uniref:glycosyltransferase family 9 protein n=1 Tax=Dechloromonas sp. H13 TaxID=2570193 RepID=UPI001291DF5E|nr:glycosyltransferase family 9 protein [Dechloromonas sp. H13]